MDPTYLHLVISHLPIFGCFLGIIVIVYGLLSKSRITIEAAYLVFILSSIGGFVAYLTGEPTKEIVEHIFGIDERNIKAHEESGELTTITLAILGAGSCLTLIFKNSLKQYQIELTKVILLIAIICFVLASRTAYLGGKIRHSEINNGRGLLGLSLYNITD